MWRSIRPTKVRFLKLANLIKKRRIRINLVKLSLKLNSYFFLLLFLFKSIDRYKEKRIKIKNRKSK